MLLLLALACAADPTPTAAAPPPALVRVAEVKAGELASAWQSPAEVVALQSAELAAAVSGPVSAVNVREGERVVKGAVLLEVEASLAAAQARSAKAAAAQARAELAQAEAQLSRAKQVTAGVLAPIELETLTLQVTALTARVEALDAAAQEAAVTLERHRVRAPFAGVITRRDADAGDWVAPGQVVLGILSDTDLELRAQLPKELLPQAPAGAAVSVLSRDSLGASVESAGTVVATVPALDPTTRTALVRVRPDGVAALSPGSSVELRLPVRWSADAALLLPRDALVLSAGEDRVMRVVDGKAEAVAVKVLVSGEDEVLVAPDPLAAGDVVIVRGNERVRPGQAVTVQE